MHAQAATGTIAGRVRNENTGAYLEGAVVSVAGTALSALSSRDGSFSLAGVPAGPATVRATYTGLSDGSAPVIVSAGGVAVVDLALTSEIYRLEAFTVLGEREGNAVSITRQRNAENLVNVVSLDAYGSVSDGNLGNFLQKIPGAGAISEAGEIVGIGLRGTPPELNSVTLDGSRMASAQAGFSPLGDRAAQIDQLPSEFIKEIEVTKSSTPDMMGDSLGGAINLVTKSAFDLRGRLLTYRAGGTLNTWRKGLDRWGPSAAVTYADTIGPRRDWGLTLSSSYVKTVIPRETQITVRNQAANENFGTLRTTDDVNDRVRIGASAKLERRLGDTLTVFASAQMSYFTFETERHDMQLLNGPGAATAVADYNRVSRASIEAGATPLTSTGATAGVAPGRTDDFVEYVGARVQYREAAEERRSRQLKLGAGGAKIWPDARLQFAASFNPSSSVNNYYGGILNRRGGFGVSLDTRANRMRAVARQTYGTPIFFGANFDEFVGESYEQPDRTEDEFGSANADYRRDFRTLAVPLTLKTGVAYRHQHRWLSRYRPIWDYVGPDRVAGVNPATRVSDDNLGRFGANRRGYGLFNGHYPSPAVLDLDSFRALYLSGSSLFAPRGTSVAVRPPNREATEEVQAGYVMGTAKIGHATLLTGVRYERTEVKGTGSNNDPLAPTQLVTTRRGGYPQVFPSAHLRYEPRRGVLLRGSWSTGSARPGIGQIIPDTNVTYGTGDSGLGTVTQNNVNLRPQYTDNFDFSAEYYLEPTGLVSVGAFRKNITDFISPIERFVGTGANNGFDGRYAGFDYDTRANVGTARIEGYELNYSQQLRFLPKPLNGLSLWANYTRLWTEGSYTDGATELAGFIPKTFNFGGSFQWRSFELRVSKHVRGRFLRAYNATFSQRSYSDRSSSTDFNLQYRVRPWLTLFADYVNAFADAPNYYNVAPHRVSTVEEYGARLSTGISGRF